MTTMRVVVLLVTVSSACTERSPTRTSGQRARPVGQAAASDASPADTGTSPPPDVPRTAVSLIVEPEPLDAVAAAGGSLAALLGAPDARDTAALAAGSRRYASLADIITADLDALAASTPRAGVGVRGHLHRLFDASWLRSPHTRFELVGVAPRLDRARLPSDCGDVRLIYRLAYETTIGGERVASRLPMTLSVSLAPHSTDCATDAERWRAPEAVATDPAALGRWLISDAGPLGRSALAPARVALVLSNLQVLRTPAAAQPALGGHAEYQLRAFTLGAHGALVEAPLENTPDIARIGGDAALRAELLAWLRDDATLEQIDRGVHRLPAKFLATTARSASPYGLARPANRSFGSLVDPRELAALPLAGRHAIATPDALLRRLDEQTCQGCHQVGAIAGFHLVGLDPPDTPAGVALAVAYSPLAARERSRRAALIDALAAGAAADFTRPPSPQDDTPSPAQVGGACELGKITGAARGARFDGMTAKRSVRCAPGLTCTRTRGGFPYGMCQASCRALPDRAVCGVIAVNPFNDCLGSGAPFSTCMRHVRPVGLARCDDATPCRDDYVCARTPEGAGACVPPYFLFPLRVDGHSL